MQKVITVKNLKDCLSIEEPVKKIIVESPEGIDQYFNFHTLRRLDGVREIQLNGSENVYSSGDMIFCRSDAGLILAFSLGTEKHVIIPEGVNIIGPEAFSYTEIQSVKFPESVEKISVEAFLNCQCLTKVELPNSLQKLGNAAFQGCLNLKSIRIPESVREISKSAFRYCVSLIDIQLPDNLEKIQHHAFAECRSLKSIDIPKSVNGIGIDAFINCSSLSDIKLPGGIQKIESHTFSHCEALRSIGLPENLQEIDVYAFYGCEMLKSIDIPNSVVEIGGHAFFDCSSLAQVTLPANLQEIEDSVFRGCSSLETINLPEGLQVIGEYAFRGCERLKSINIPGSVWNIGNRAFSVCESLTHVDFHEGLESIEEDAFHDCRLEEISLPASVCRLKPGSLKGAELIHVKKYIPDLIDAVAHQEKIFCIDCGTEKIVLPGDMTQSSVEKAKRFYQSVMNCQESGQKVHALYRLGNTAKAKHLAALSAYRYSKTEELKKYIKRNGIKFLEYVRSEDEMMDLLNVFREIGVTDGILRKGLALSEDRGWTIATAYILKQPKKISKSSFSL